MQFISNAFKTKSGVMAVLLLLLIVLVIFTFSYGTMGAPGITYGDVNQNGTIDVNDVVLIMQHVLGTTTLTDKQIEAADVNCDGKVNINDAILVMQYSLELIDTFPIYLKIDSVEDVAINVPYGTPIDDIEFPATVEVTLYNESEEDIDVEWEDSSAPAYNPRSANDYVFEGELVDLPNGITNPDEIKASATVTVYLPWKLAPPVRPDPDPDPDPDLDWPEMMEGEPVISYIDLAEKWAVYILIKDQYVDEVTSVTIKGEAANQNPDEPEWWVVVFDDEPTLADLENEIVISTDPVAVDVIDMEKTRAILGVLDDAELRVYLKPGETANEVTADDSSLSYNDDDDRWETTLYGYEEGDLITVEATTDIGVQTEEIEVEKVD